MIRVIKRYSNRRLYDTESSRTITQSDLSKMVKERIELKVIDSQTGKDITVPVLGRLMLFETTHWSDHQGSQELFKAIILTGGKYQMSILKNTILASLGALQVTKEKATRIIDELIKKGELDSSERKKAIMELLKKADKSTADFRKKVSTEAAKVQKDVSTFVNDMKLSKQSDFKRLEAKVDKIGKQLKKIETALAGLSK
ncbi:MAG: phasin family protein [candidate division Zixibacteria bacterium]|nr:phasin family protein [candidate division Zixibacteria bacterium]